MKILVIGGTGAVGKTVVEKLKADHEVIIASRTSGDVQVDITSVESIKKMYEAIPNIDAVVSATGSAHIGPLSEMTPELNEVALNSKLSGQINLVLIGQHYLNDGGSFTLTTGIMMDDPILQGSSSAMANSGVTGFVKAAAIELQRGIRINTVSPGLLEESHAKNEKLFRGFEEVPGSKVANAYVKSIEGAQTGQVYRVYE